MARRTTRIAAALGTLVLAASMTACAGRPGTAATVGSERIAVSEVNEVSDALSQLYGPVPGLPSYVLNVKMRASAAEQVAAGEGIDLGAAAEQALGAQDAPPAGGVSAVLRDFAVDSTQVEVLASEIGAGAMEERFAEIPVTVNPRFGLTGLEPMRFNENQLPVVANPSLSKPHGAAQ